MSWFSSIFSPDVVNKSVDGVIDGIDAVFYTDEEKARAKQLAIDTKMKMLPLFEPFKIAQRILAIIFVINFVLAFWLGVILMLWFPDDLNDFLNLIATFYLGIITLTIISFYFGGGFVEGMIGKIKEKGK